MGQHLSRVENCILEDFVEPKAYLVLTLINSELCSSDCGLGLRTYSPSRELTMAVTPGDMSTVHPLLHFAGNHGTLWVGSGFLLCLALKSILHQK